MTTAAQARPLPSLRSQPLSMTSSSVDGVTDTGLRIIAVRLASVPVIELRLHVPFAAPEPDDECRHAARAAVLADGLLAGTGSRDRAALDAALARIGGTLVVDADAQRLQVHGYALADRLDALLDLLADVLTGAAYPDGAIVASRHRVARGLEVRLAQPDVRARAERRRHCHQGHPYGREFPETADVRAVTGAELRALHRRAVRARGSTLVLVGDVHPEEAAVRAEAALAGWRSPGRAGEPRPVPPVAGGLVVTVPQAVPQAGPQQEASRSQIALAAAAVPRYDPQHPALALANQILGGYFSSRLVANLRERRGWTYAVRSYLDHPPGGASIVVETATAAAVAGPALAEIRAELARMRTDPPGDDEVAAARRYAVGSHLMTVSAQSGLASALLAAAADGLGPDWLFAQPRRFAAVEPTQVRRVAAEFLDPARFTGVVLAGA